ncbi:MAG: hypothetical protein AABP62_10080 [Planctomycetota bacterium]
MNSPSNRRHAWLCFAVACSCCGLLFVGDAENRTMAQEKPNFGPFETRESDVFSPADRKAIQGRPVTLIGQVETPAAEAAPSAGRAPDAAAAAAKSRPAPEFLPRLVAVEERILSALNETTEVGFVDSPLHEALEVLKELHGIEIWLDKEALSADGIAMDSLVNLRISGVALRSALRLILEPLALTCIIEDEVLKVTTREAAGKVFVTRTYPAGDLFESHEEANELVEVIASGLGLRPKQSEMTPRSASIKTPVKVVDSGESARTNGSGTTLEYGNTDVIALTELIQEDTSGKWNTTANVSGTIVVSVKTRAIVVRQTHAVHDQIRQLLRDLREAKALVPTRPAAEIGAPRNPKLLDEFSPGLDPDEFNKRGRGPGAQPDKPSSSGGVPAPADPATRKKI